jgi:photosystem II stability/assembly factor-like uncharacterized protein
MRRFLRFVGAVILAGASSQPSVAKANGRFPTANQLVVDPADPARIVVRATIGVLMSTDAGKTWSWICESAYSRTVLLDDPAIGITADGSILVGGSNGMSRGAKDGCSFATAKGALVDKQVIDLAVEPANRAHAYAVYGVPPDSGVANDPPIAGAVAVSVDNGASWSDVGSIIDDFTPFTIDVAPSNPNVLYASGLDAVGTHQLLFRSDDAGKNWKRSVIPGSGNVYIAAVDPFTPDTIYVRTDADQSRLMVSDDGGVTFRELHSANDLLIGFALSPDGKQVAVGSEAEGVSLLTRAAVDGGAWTLEKIRSFEVACLTWAAAGLYACSNEQRDGFAVGLSPDARQAFSPLLLMPDLRPLQCPSDPLRCAADWCTVAPTLSIDAGCAPDPTSGDAGPGAPSDASALDASLGPIGDAQPPVAPMSSGGCGCRLRRQSAVGRGQLGSTIGALLCAFVVAWRRHKRTSQTAPNGMAERI